MEGFGWYTFEVVKRLAENHPEHEFIFFFDRPFDPKFVFSKNVEPVVLFPPARHPILFRWWFNLSISRALKKYKADIFFSPDGYLSLKTSIPQVPVIHDLNFEHYPEDLPAKHRNYYRRYFPKFAKKASKIITVSNYSKEDIAVKYGIKDEKIIVAWNGASSAFVPLNNEEIERVRNKYTSGKPYFIYVGAIHPRKNVGRLLSAFIDFAAKNAEIDLLIVGESIWNTKSSLIPEVSEEFKKRVIFTGHIPLGELSQLMGAAFALTYVPYFEGFGIPLVEAMKCGLPILSGNLTCLPEVAGNAAIYVNPFNVNEISGAMEELASSEDLRIKLSQESLKRAKLFSWDYTAETVWNVLENVFKNMPVT